MEGLPDVTLHNIICIVWDARPAAEASSEVQLALSLHCLSRRIQQVLRAYPLQLRLDFSNTQLAKKHLAWLALPAWKDHVTSLTLYNWLTPACEGRSRNFLDPGLCAEDDVVSPLLTVLRANQCDSLRQLLGMPLRLGGVVEPLLDYFSAGNEHLIQSLPYTLHVDFCAFHLSHLGISGGFNDRIDFDMLPQTVISMVYRAAHRDANVSFWQPLAAAQADVRVFSGSPVVDFTRSQALDSWHANIEGRSVHMDAMNVLNPISPCRTYIGTRDVRIDARGVSMCYYHRAGEQQLGLEKALIDLLCPPCLDSMEIISGTNYPTIGQYPGQHDIPNAWRLVMHKMMMAYGSKFAFQIDDGRQKRAAWRRWPAPGTQEHHAACRLHEAAAAWAGVGV